MFKKNKTDNKDRIRSEMHYRRVKGYLQTYIKRCQKIADDYMEKGRQAAKVGNTAMMRQFAIGYRTMIDKRLAAEKILLSMESMNLNVEQDEISRKFLDYARMFEAVAGGKGIKEKDYERMLENITQRDASLNSIIDAINDRILLTDESDLDEIMTEMKGDEENELEKKLDSILEMMKEQKNGNGKGKTGGKKGKRQGDEEEDEDEEESQTKKRKNERKRREILEDIEEKLREIEKYT